MFQVAWFFYLILATSAILWLGWARNGLEIGIFLDPQSWWIDGVLGLLAGGFLVCLWRLGSYFVAEMRVVESYLADHLGTLDRPMVISLAIISGFSEELFFRGAVQTSFGWIVATLLFALVHSGPHRAFRWWTLFALIAGLLFSGLTLLRGNLLAAILGHITVNGINLWLLSRTGPSEGSATS